MFRGQTDRGYKKPVTNTDIEIAIPLGMKRIPDSEITKLVNSGNHRYNQLVNSFALVCFVLIK